MERFNPLNDFVFKKIFGEKENKDLLISLLNSILCLLHNKSITLGLKGA